MYKFHALIAEKIYNLHRHEIKAFSLPNKYQIEVPNQFPREDSYLLATDEGFPVYWVPGHCNDCFVLNAGTPTERHIEFPPHFTDDDGPSREMEERIYQMGLTNKYVEELKKTVGGQDNVSVLLTANCEQRAFAAAKVLGIEVDEKDK